MYRFALRPVVSNIYNFPLTTMLNVPRKNKKNIYCKKSKIFNFTILYTTLVGTLPGSMHGFLGANLFFSHGNENGKNRKKSKMQNFVKQNKNKTKQNKKKKNGLEICCKGTFPPNLALICLTCSEKTGFTDERRADDGWTTDDGRPRHDSSSAVQ